MPAPPACRSFGTGQVALYCSSSRAGKDLDRVAPSLALLSTVFGTVKFTVLTLFSFNRVYYVPAHTVLVQKEGAAGTVEKKIARGVYSLGSKLI